jgi:hypothetical protein
MAGESVPPHEVTVTAVTLMFPAGPPPLPTDPAPCTKLRPPDTRIRPRSSKHMDATTLDSACLSSFLGSSPAVASQGPVVTGPLPAGGFPVAIQVVRRPSATKASRTASGHTRNTVRLSNVGKRQGIGAVSERREETTSAQWWRPLAAGAIVTIWATTIAEIWRLCPVGRRFAVACR